MKRLHHLAVGVTIFGAMACIGQSSEVTSTGKSQAKHSGVRVIESLNGVNIPIGLLGVPVGTVVGVDVEVVDGSLLNEKLYNNKTLLRVVAVNGRSLEQACLLPFSWIRNAHEVQLQHGKRLQLVVYEMGLFSGVPKEAWNYVTSYATPEVYFMSYLVLLKAGQE